MNIKQFRLSLGTRVFLATSFLLIAALGSIVFATFDVGKGVASKSAEESINNSLALQHHFRELNDRELLIILDGFASDPSFSGYVAEAVEGEDGESDIASIQDLLFELKAETELDFIIVLDPDGNVIIHSESPAITGRDFSQKKMVAPVIEELTESTGIWIENKQMYQAAMMPLSIDYDLVGFIIAGMVIDNSIATEMKQIGGGDTLFMIASENEFVSVASSFDIAKNNRALEQLDQFKSEILSTKTSSFNDNSEKIKIDLDEQNWVIQSVALAEKENNQIPLLLVFSSESKYMTGYNKIFNVILIASIIAIVISIFVSYFITSGVLTPIKKLAKAAGSAAKGDYTTQVGLSGSDELAVLSNSIDSLLSDLRDKDDMQSYITELSKILPDEQASGSGAGGLQKLPESSGFYSLLAIDVNAMIDHSAEAKSAIFQLQQLCDLVRAQVENADGLLVRIGAGLFIGAFQQENGAEVACSTAGGIDKILMEQSLRNDKKGAKYSLACGECYMGNINANSSWQRMFIGNPVRQCLRLLQDASINRLLATNDVYKKLKDRLKKSGVGISAYEGRLSGKKICSINLIAAHDYVMPLSSEQTQIRASLTSLPLSRIQEHDFSSGSIFAQRYEIMTSLGKGSMGLVFKAMDNELQEPVALKILRKEIAEDSEHLERLRSEIKLARRVTHPNILRTYDFGKVEEVPFLSMEYVRGMTLRYLIDNSGKLPYSAALRVSKQLCDGLDSVHQLGILHRDIKAENVILEANGNVKLMDFGIARTIKKSEIDKLDQGMFVGTPSYASPEQVQGETLGVASDIYSLGILMTEIFTGKLPIVGDDVSAICIAHVHQQPIAPSELWSDIPPRLEQIILKCLQKKATERYVDINQLINELEELNA